MTRGQYKNSVMLLTCSKNTSKEGMDESYAGRTRNHAGKKSVGFNT